VDSHAIEVTPGEIADRICGQELDLMAAPGQTPSQRQRLCRCTAEMCGWQALADHQNPHGGLKDPRRG
jgi:hypothetical protein